MSSGIAESPRSAPTLSKLDEPLDEVVNGKRVELPPMSIYSSLVAGRIYARLAAFLAASPQGTAVMESLLILDRELDLRRRPDVAYVSLDRWPLDREVPEEGDWEVVPTLAVEVTSPHDIFREVHAKVREYFEYGVQQVWVVIPEEQQVYVYTSPTRTDILDASGVLTGGDMLPGFEMTLRNLFSRTPVSGSS